MKINLPVSVDPVIREAFRTLEQDRIKDNKGNAASEYGVFYDKGGYVFNVQHPDFGAKADGTTDDSTAVQAAFDAMVSAGGGRVYFPPGTYSIGTGLTLNGAAATNKFIVDGSGWSTILKWDGAADGDLLTVKDTSGGFVLSNMRLQGDTTNIPNALVRLREETAGFGNSFGLIQNVMVGTVGGAGSYEMKYGILYDGTESVNNSEWVLQSVKIDGASVAGVWQASIQNLNHIWQGVYISRCDVGVRPCGSVSGTGVFFFENYTADIQTPLNDDFSAAAVPRVHFMEMGSEHSNRLAEINGPIVMSIVGGYWQITDDINADGKIIKCENNSRQSISISDYRFSEDGGYTGPSPSFSIKSLAAGASVKHVKFDGIYNWENIDGGIDVATQGSTDRRFVYLRFIDTTSNETRESVNILNGAGSLNFDEERQNFVGFLEGQEMTEPSAPTAATGSGKKRGRLYFKDNGSGKTQLAVRFETGAVQILATQP